MPRPLIAPGLTPDTAGYLRLVYRVPGRATTRGHHARMIRSAAADRRADQRARWTHSRDAYPLANLHKGTTRPRTV